MKKIFYLLSLGVSIWVLPLYAEEGRPCWRNAVGNQASRSDTLHYEGVFESFEESPSPHVLDQTQKEMMLLECESIPVRFYISEDAKEFLLMLKPGDRIHIQGRPIGVVAGSSSMVAVDVVEKQL